MAEHTVNVTTPPLEVGKVDVKFEVRQNGSKFGTLKISRGGVEWMQRSDKKKAFHTLRVNIAETLLLALITEQGENGLQLEFPRFQEEWTPSGPGVFA